MLKKNLKKSVKIIPLIFTLLLLVMITDQPEANISGGTLPHSSPEIAYVYGSNMTHATLHQSFLESNGFTTALINQSEITPGMFADFRLILIGSFTHWSGETATAIEINNSRKPIIALGAGGSLFFGELPHLYTNWGHSWVVMGNSDIVVNDSSHPIFIQPNGIGVGTHQLYTASRSVALYLPSPKEDINVLGRQATDPHHYHIVQEKSRYMLWGYYASPEYMTQVGKELFINVIHYFSGPRVAYVHAYDEDTTHSYRSLLEYNGFITDLINMTNTVITSDMFTEYAVIILGPETGPWTVETAKRQAINESQKRIIGLGMAGYYFFGGLDLDIGYPYGWHGSINNITVVDSSHPFFNHPHSIPSGNITLYTSTGHIGINLATPPESVVLLGKEPTDPNHYPLVQQHERYLFWGFSASPTNMTQIGKDLFINILGHSTDLFKPRLCLDQVQEGTGYGFVFSDTWNRWQEFIPNYTSLAQLDLYFQRLGDPGDIQVNISDGQTTLWITTVLEAEMPKPAGWITIPLPTALSLIPGNSYYISVRSVNPMVPMEHYYSWSGNTDSDYTQGNTSVQISWPTYDFAFRTWSLTCYDACLDQAQEKHTYGFWFEKEVIRWQEFKPIYSSLAQIDLVIWKVGDPVGNLKVAINDSTDRLWETTVLKRDIASGENWIVVPVKPILDLIPGESYFIYVWSDTVSPDPSNRYFWRGNHSSTYDRGITSVEGSWPEYDFAFRTWSVSCSVPDMCLNQAQEEYNYGFWFEASVIRWQEFTTSYTTLDRLDLYINKRGNPGNMKVAINDSTDRLWETTIMEADVPMWGWIEISVPTLSLIPEESYFIVVWSDSPSPDPENRYFWSGKTDSSYERGITSVETAWPGFDFAFRTWSINCETEIPTTEITTTALPSSTSPIEAPQTTESSENGGTPGLSPGWTLLIGLATFLVIIPLRNRKRRSG
ncbi:MAG: hypothetical protein ACFFC6_10805 [Promethearchaeota archaeon]